VSPFSALSVKPISLAASPALLVQWPACCLCHSAICSEFNGPLLGAAAGAAGAGAGVGAGALRGREPPLRDGPVVPSSCSARALA